MMRRSMKWCLVISIVLSTCIWADEEVSFDLSLDYNGKYIWRGQNLVDDPVFQPGLSASIDGLTLGIWGNLETTNINDKSGDFSEVDYYIEYGGDVPDVEGLSYTIGYIYYDFPGTNASGGWAPSTSEVYWGLSLDAMLSPSLFVAHDIDEADGTYVSIGCGHSVEQVAELSPGSPIAMEFSASIGWGSDSYNKYYWGPADSKVNDLTLGLACPFEMSGWTVTPTLNYVTLLSESIRKTDTYDTASDYFYAGIGISTSF